MNATTNYIDVHKRIKESNSKFLKGLPGFVVSLIKIIIRQDEINRILTAYADYKGVDFLSKIVSELNIKVVIDGQENLPDNGRCFFVANHPFGFADGLILTNIVSQKYGDFRAIGNELFLLIPQVRPIVAAVNVFGTNPRKYLLELEKVFASNLPITHFPAGLVSRMKGCRVEDRDWQKSFVTKAVEHQRDIVPIFFHGRNSRLFYLIYIGRKMLRINATLELALLPREIFNKKNRTIRVKIGKPISHHTFNSTKTHFEWAQYVKQKVYSLKN